MIEVKKRSFFSRNLCSYHFSELRFEIRDFLLVEMRENDEDVIILE